MQKYIDRITKTQDMLKKNLDVRKNTNIYTPNKL